MLYWLLWRWRSTIGPLRVHILKPGSRGVFQGPRTNSVLDYFVVCKFGHVDKLKPSAFGIFSFFIFALPSGDTMTSFLFLSFLLSKGFSVPGFYRPIRSALLIVVWGSLYLTRPSLTWILLMMIFFSSRVVAPLRGTTSKGDWPFARRVVRWPAFT